MPATQRSLPLIALACLLAIIPLLWPTTPPLLDLPGHIGAYHIGLDLAHSADLQCYYSFHWAPTGNLGVDLAVHALGRLLGVELAAKLVVIAIPLLTTLGFLRAAREVHGRIPTSAALALPLAYNYPFHYGFVNYCLAMAFASLALVLWIRLFKAGQFKCRAALFLVVAPMIWLTHAIGWLLLTAMCAATELQLRREADDKWPRALALTALACVPLALPALLQFLVASGQPTTLSGMFDPAALAKWVLALNRDRWIALDIASTALLLAILALTALRAFGLRFNPLLLAPALVLTLLYLVMPQGINGSAFVSARIAPYAAAYALLAIDPSQLTATRHRLLVVLALSFLLVRTASTTASFWLYDRSYGQVLGAVEQIRPGSAVAVFARQSCTAGLSGWTNSRLQHLGGLAITRRNVFVNDQWTNAGLQLVGTHYQQAAPFLGEPSEVITLEPCARNGTRYLPAALRQLPRAAFQYVWLLDVPAAARPQLPWLKLVHETPASALYTVAPQ